MLNNIINADINYNVNKLKKINLLNDKVKKTLEKYKEDDISRKNYFKTTQNIVCLENKRDLDNKVITDDSEYFNQDTYNSRNNTDIKNLIKKSNQTVASLQNIQDRTQNSNYKFIPSILNSEIKKINNVYKINFKNSKSSGFGDFIRGCYFLLEFCEKHNVEFDFHIYDSNIKFFLKYFYNKPNIPVNVADEIDKFIKINADLVSKNGMLDYNINNTTDNEFVEYLNNSKLYSNNIYVNTINFPKHNISKIHLDFMKHILEPIDQIKIELDNILNNLQLVKRKFITYHIRLGDEYLNNHNNKLNIYNIQKVLNKIKINKFDNYLLISDSIIIKNILKNKFPNIKTLQSNSVHTLENDINNLKNTLIDFYLMSQSNQIVSFSVYKHGSGFSKWCAVTYEIPYVCYSIF